MDWLPEDLTRHLAEPGGMKKSRAQRNVFIRSEIRMDSGTPRISDQSCGTFLIRESINPKVFAFFRFQIGPSLMCGSTSMSKKFRLCRCITRESARLWSATDRLS